MESRTLRNRCGHGAQIHREDPPLAPYAKALAGVTIPGEQNPHYAEAIAAAARAVGIPGFTAASVEAALRDLRSRGTGGRVLICGSLHLAGTVLAENS